MTIDPNDLLNLLRAGARTCRCGIYIHNLDSLQRHHIYQELEVERLYAKYSRIQKLLSKSANDWNQLFLYGFLDSLADMDNRSNYNAIAQIVSVKMIQRERASLQNIEALLIGVAGLHCLLPNNSYGKELKDSAKFMLHKYHLEPLPIDRWKIKRLISVKHPIVRLSQVARLFYNNEYPFNKLVSCTKRDDIIALFGVEASMDLCKIVNHKALNSSSIGVAKCDLIGVNFVVPTLYAYGIFTSDDSIVDRAGNLNEMLPPESNFYITAWRSRGLVPSSAYETQALIQLSKVYCSERRCDECFIYRHMVSQHSILDELPIFTEYMR